MTKTISDLEEIARKCRVEIVKMVHRAQALAGHVFLAGPDGIVIL